MGKIYCGEQGSGKTTKLLLQADAITEEDLVPIIAAYNKAFFDVIKERAKQLSINTNGWVFLTFKEIMEPENRRYFQNGRYRIFIEELTIFVKEVLFGDGPDRGFYATLSSEDCVEIKRNEARE